MGADHEYSDDPAFLLYRALVTGQKIFYASGDGNVNKKTVVCSDLTSVSDQDGNQVHIVDPNSSANGQTRDITGVTTAGTITVGTAFDAQITEATAFILTGIRSTPVEVAAFETWVKAAIGDASGHTLTSLVTKWGDITRSLDLMLGARWDTSGDLGTDIANIITAIAAIQNNTRFTAAVPVQMCKPDAGNEAFRMASNLYDTEGNMEDPTNNEILVRIIKDDGTYITADLYKENGLSNGLDNATDGTTFPAASGWRAMEREAEGKFFFFMKVTNTATEQSLTVEFGWTELTKHNYQSRSTEIADVHGDLTTLLDYVDYEGATSLADKLTVARAGYLDILDSDSKYILSTALTAPTVNSLVKFIASGGTGLGTTLAASKSLIDAIGADGDDTLSHDFSEAGVMQYAHGKHLTTYILFVIPEAVGSISAHNTAIKTSLEKLGRVLTITQADALSYPDFNTYTLCVLGSNNGTAWTTSNLAHIKELTDMPVVCCDSVSAAYLEMGTANANVTTTKALFGVANIEGSIVGMGLHDRTGLAVGTQDIADVDTTFASLNMSDGDITEVYYGYETSNDNAHVLLGKIRFIQPDGTIGVDEEGEEIPGSRYFYGPAYSFNALNSLGQDVFEILVLGLIHSKTIGHSIAISGEIRSLEKVLFGTLKNTFSNANPLAKYLGTGGVGLGRALPNSTSLVDLFGNFTGPYNGTAQDDNVKASLDLAHTDLDTIITDIGALNNITAANVWELNISAYSGAGYAGTYLKTLYDDWVNGGRLDLLLDACSTHSPVNVRQSVCLTGDPANSIGKLLFDNLNAPVGSIPTTPTLQGTWTDAKAAFLDEDISAAKTLTVAERTAIRKSVCLTGDTASSIGKILYELYNTRLTATKSGYLDELDFDLDARLDTKVAGKAQIAKTTEDLNQAAATYDLFTGTTQDVILESLLVRMPDIVAAGALTSISIQTNDTTPQVLLSAADGAVANLTAEAQLAWQNFNAPILIKTGKKIQLTIAGGAHGVAYVCDIVAKVRAVTSGGYLA